MCTSMDRDLQLLPPSAAARNVAEACKTIKAEGLHSRGNPLSGRGENKLSGMGLFQFCFNRSDGRERHPWERSQAVSRRATV